MSLKNKKILIAGADGFIGSHLSEMLVKQGARVKALSYYNSFTFIDGKALLFKLAEDFRIDLIHGIFRQFFSEARESRMIWIGVAKRNTQKLFEWQSVVYPVKLFEDP